MDEESAEALTRTKALYDAGVLTEEEYNAKKNELLHAPAVVVAQPPAIVAQPPANEYGGVVEGHVVAVQPQKVHPEPRPQEDILANYRSNEEASRAATLIQAEARSRAAWKDYPLPPGATSATICKDGGSALESVVPASARRERGGRGGAASSCRSVALGVSSSRHTGTTDSGRPTSAVFLYPQIRVALTASFTVASAAQKKNMFKIKEGDCKNTLYVHNSFCATLFGCQGIFLCCPLVMCRIPL